MDRFWRKETAVESKQEVISPSTTQKPSASHALIREWLFRFGVEHKEDVAPRLPLWLEAFAGMDAETLERLFRRALRDCKFFPKVSDILEPLKKTEEAHVPIEAERKWEQVLAYAVRLSPDFPDRNPPRISDRTMTAIRAAGGLDYLRDCEQESLQWARKRFIENYTAWNALERNQFLLPDGELKNLIAGAAQKLLPGEMP